MKKLLLAVVVLVGCQSGTIVPRAEKVTVPELGPGSCPCRLPQCIPYCAQ